MHFTKSGSKYPTGYYLSLENKLHEYQSYYNENRCHSGRDGSTPIESADRKVIDINGKVKFLAFPARSHCAASNDGKITQCNFSVLKKD